MEASAEVVRKTCERGDDAGMRYMDDEENPYPEGSTLTKAFEHGYLHGQKARRQDMLASLNGRTLRCQRIP